MINPKLVTIADFTEAEIPAVLNYWFHSPPGFVEEMGVDFAKMPAEAQMQQSLIEKVRKDRELPKSKLNVVTICYDGQAIGMHTLFPITEGESAVFHAHNWTPSMRGQGIGMISYPLACQRFIERFDLKRIAFKTPLQNTAAIRVKEKLGIRSTGEEIIDFGIMKAGTRAQAFEWSREEINFHLTRNAENKQDTARI